MSHDRPARPSPRILVALLVILATAALLRGVHLDFGLPATFHPDEVGATDQTRRVLDGHLEIRGYKHPPLLKNLALVPLVAGRLAGRTDLHSDTSIVLALRGVSFVAGLAAVLLAYALARAFVAPWAALVAAALVAVIPLPVFSSMYGTPDMLQSALMAAGLVLAVRLHARPSRRLYTAAGLATALAVGAKYPGGVVFLSVLLADVLARRRREPVPVPLPTAAGLFLAGAIVGIVVSFPLLLTEFRSVVNGVHFEIAHLFAHGHRGYQVSGRDEALLHHFRRSILPVAGPAFPLAAIAGLVLMAVRREARGWILLATVIPYYVLIEWVYLVPPAPDRYVLPLIVPYAVAAAVAAERLVRLAASPRSRTALATLAVALLLVWPSARTVTFLGGVSPDTRTTMGAWMAAELPPNTAIWVERPLAYYPPASFLPRGYQTFDPRSEGGLIDGRRERWVLTSSFAYDRWLARPDQEPEAARFYRTLAERGELVHEVADPAHRYLFHNPTLRLYRVGRTPHPSKRR